MPDERWSDEGRPIAALNGEIRAFAVAEPGNRLAAYRMNLTRG